MKEGGKKKENSIIVRVKYPMNDENGRGLLV